MKRKKIAAQFHHKVAMLFKTEALAPPSLQVLNMWPSKTRSKMSFFLKKDPFAPHLVYKAVCFNKTHRVPKKKAEHAWELLDKFVSVTAGFKGKLALIIQNKTFKIPDVLAHLPTNGIFFLFCGILLFSVDL